MADTDVTLGIDLGGTGTRIVAIDADGAIRHEVTVATPRHVPPMTAVADLVEQIRLAGRGSELRGVGIGASGPIDADGIIRNDDTLPAFSHVPLVDIIRGVMQRPCLIDNDAVTAAIGENTYGAGKQSPGLLMITLGTGVGVSMLIDGLPFRSADGTHPEAGHLPIPGPAAPCYCGLDICWEQLASRTALDVATGQTTAETAARADGGDRDALKLFELYGERVGLGASALATIFRPDRLVIGGSAAKYLPLFAAGFERGLARNPSFAWTPPYDAGQLGALSGAIGAAVMVRVRGEPTLIT
jgi:glucokinase